MPTDTTTDLLHALHNGTQHQQYNALLYIGLHGIPNPLATLKPCLHHADWGVRQGAAWALGTLQLTDAIPALRQLITRPGEDEQVRYVAALSLARIPGNQARQTLQQLVKHSSKPVQRVAQSALYAVPLWEF